jgi:N-acetylglucosamine kinase-like BadF-type ATPase
MAFFLGIDAGGTKTDYALADECRILARVRSGSIKRMRVDADAAAHHLETALAELTAQTGISMSRVRQTCIGTAGETVPLVTGWLRAEFSARVAGDLLILGDVEIALDAAFRGEPGVLVLAGTGSNVAARTLQGRVITAGGWGPALADQGSGHRIGKQALRALCLARDEEETTLLLPAVLEFWHLSSFDDLVAYANGLPAPDFSQLTRTVVECADRGDAVAQSVLVEQGRELAHLACVLMRRICRDAQSGTFVPRLAFAGSIMEKVARVREALIARVREEYPESMAMEGVVDPVEGALWRARSAAGLS